MSTEALTADPALIAESDPGANPPMPSGRSISVLGMRVDELNYDRAMTQICRWAEAAESRYMCVSTAHMVMESHDDPKFREIVNGADLVCSDGVPVVWVSRLLGLSEQSRVFGPELTIRLCALAERKNIGVGFCGGTPSMIEGLKNTMRERFPRLDVAYAYSPPFRPLTEAENQQIAADINASRARIVFVGLGCPKQERWMRLARPQVKAVMLGVGWAFDIWSGQSHAAPPWIQVMGLEWLYRLIENPKKLWKRHLKNNPRFVVLVLLQLLGITRYRVDPMARGH